MATHETPGEIAAGLRQFDQAWGRAAAPDEDYYSDIPDGLYEAVIEEARVTETVTTGRPMVVWKLRIQGPVAARRSLPKVRVITENTVAWLREDLRKCGLELDRISDLPARIQEIEGKLLSVEKRTKDGRMNVYFRWPERKPIPAADDGLPF